MGATNLGIAFRCRGDPKVLLTNTAKLAEASGFSGIWIVEVNDVDAFALAGALSEVTQSIKIASGVVGSSLRLPTLLAMGAITVSEFSTGRFVLGIGAGTPPVTFSGESKSDSPLLRLKETLQSVRGCLETASKKTGPFSFAGQTIPNSRFQSRSAFQSQNSHFFRRHGSEGNRDCDRICRWSNFDALHK